MCGIIEIMQEKEEPRKAGPLKHREFAFISLKTAFHVA